MPSSPASALAITAISSSAGSTGRSGARVGLRLALEPPRRARRRADAERAELLVLRRAVVGDDAVTRGRCCARRAAARPARAPAPAPRPASAAGRARRPRPSARRRSPSASASGRRDGARHEAAAVHSGIRHASTVPAVLSSPCMDCDQHRAGARARRRERLLRGHRVRRSRGCGPGQVEKWVSDGRPGSKSVKHAIEHIDSYLAACQLGITISSLGLGALGEPAFHHLLEPVLGEGAKVAGIGLASAVSFGIITLLHVVVGELAPKSLAISRTQPIALFVAPVMRVFYLVHQAARRPLQRDGQPAAQAVRHPARARGRPRAGQRGRAALAPARERGGRRDRGGGAALHRERADLRRPARARGDDAARPRSCSSPPTRASTTSWRSSASRASRACRCARPTAGLDAPVGLLHVKDLLVSGPDKPLKEHRAPARARPGVDADRRAARAPAQAARALRARGRRARHGGRADHARGHPRGDRGRDRGRVRPRGARADARGARGRS